MHKTSMRILCLFILCLICLGGCTVTGAKLPGMEKPKLTLVELEHEAFTAALPEGYAMESRTIRTDGRDAEVAVYTYDIRQNEKRVGTVLLLYGGSGTAPIDGDPETTLVTLALELGTFTLLPGQEESIGNEQGMVMELRAMNGMALTGKAGGIIHEDGRVLMMIYGAEGTNYRKADEDALFSALGWK